MKKTRLEELENWANITLEMDSIRKKCCTAIKDADECKKCPFWQMVECFEVAPINNSFEYEATDIAKMLAVGESIYNLMRLGVYKCNEEDW